MTRPTQPDLFGAAAPQASTIPSPESIRSRVEAVLTVLRTADEMPWTAAEIRSWSLVIPQMSNWLPETERDSVRAEFATQMSRLGAAVA